MGTLLTHYRSVLSELGWGGRPAIDEAIEVMDSAWEGGGVFLVEAPTGYGKTAVSLAVARYSVVEEAKAVIAYPLRTLLEDQLGRFEQVFGELVGARYMMNSGSPYLVKPVTLTTIDTLSMTYLGLAPEDLNKVMRGYDDGTATRSLGHYLFSRASVMMSNVVIDEAHLMADLPRGLDVLVALAATLADEGARLVLMTATAPKKLPELLRRAVGADAFTHIPFRPRSGDPFVEERERKEYSVEARPSTVAEVVEWVASAGEGMGRRGALLVFNTVAEAVEAFKHLSRAGGWVSGAEKVLIHSRFAAAHRRALSERLRAVQASGRDYVVVATQVVEAGVDMTSNIFASDAAPPTSLIQRAGRFLRRGEAAGKALIWWSEGGDDGLSTRVRGGEETYKVYPAGLVRETIEWVRRGRPGLHLPTYPSGSREGYADLIDKAYEGAYSVAHSLVTKLEDIIRDVDYGPQRVARLVDELGGSLLRDDALVPVVPEALLRKGLGPAEASVPITSRLAARLVREGLVKGVLKSDGSITPIEWPVWRHRSLARAVVSLLAEADGAALVADLGYDEVTGLALG